MVRVSAGPGDLTSSSVAARGSFPRVQWPECEADYIPPFIAKLTNAGSPYLHSPYALMAWCLMNNSCSFRFHLHPGLFNNRGLDNLPTDGCFTHNLPVTCDKHCSET